MCTQYSNFVKISTPETNGKIVRPKKKQKTNRELFISAAFVSVWLVFNGNWYDLQTNYVGFSQKRNSACVWLPIREYRKLQEVINLCLSYKFGIVYGEETIVGTDEQTDRQAGRQGRWGGNIDCEVILFLVSAIFGLIGKKITELFAFVSQWREKTTGIAYKYLDLSI